MVSLSRIFENYNAESKMLPLTTDIGYFSLYSDYFVNVLRYHDSVPGRRGIFFSPHSEIARYLPLPAPWQMVIDGDLSEKHLRCETVYPTPSGAEPKNVCTYTSAPHVPLQSCSIEYKENLTVHLKVTWVA
jgi:hypothetical protein